MEMAFNSSSYADVIFLGIVGNTGHLQAVNMVVVDARK
jgi:hypothetical protein